MNLLRNTRVNCLLPRVFKTINLLRYNKCDVVSIQNSMNSNKNLLYYQSIKSFWKQNREQDYLSRSKSPEKEQGSELHKHHKDVEAKIQQENLDKKTTPEEKISKAKIREAEAEAQKQKEKEETIEEKIDRLVQEKSTKAYNQLREILKIQTDQISLKSKAIEELAVILKNNEKINEDLRKKILDIRNSLQNQIEETEQQRKRLQKEIEQTKTFALTQFAKDLIETTDNLSKTLENSSKHYEGTNHSLYEGIKATYALLLKTLEKYGIKSINPIKEKFNPNFHEVISDKEDSNLEPGTIYEVDSIGYIMGDKVLRPAKVIIVKRPKNKE